MTSLEKFLDLLPEETILLTGYQQTPGDLYLVYSREDFFKIIDFFPSNQILFRFVEIKPNRILTVHLIYYDLPNKINITFEIKDFDDQVLKKLKEIFPASEISLL